MKTAITVRVDAALLIEARRCARLENRTLTNFIETLLQRRIVELAGSVPDGSVPDGSVPDGAGTRPARKARPPRKDGVQS